jgi:alkanesulfonate monooxygenase SsuD/methylene tetrahydromethanopterin reductase-like flavin-dependent oxidoreductase (luciferase family)
LVVLDRTAGERPLNDDIQPLEGSAERIAAGLQEFAEAGADEVILVLSPITERSIRRLGESLALLDQSSSASRSGI